MRARTANVWGAALAVLGVLCLAAAAILVWVVVPDRKELPADTDTIRQFDGTARMLLNPQALAAGDLAGALRTNVPVSAQRQVRVLATDGDMAEVSDVRSLSAGDGQPLGRTEATYAVDRSSLQAAPDAPAEWNVVDHEGLTVTWPIGAEQRDYTGWVNETQTTTTLRYAREESKGGVQTYVYESESQAAPVKDEQVLETLPPALPKGVLTTLAGALPMTPETRAQLAQVLPQLADQVSLGYTYQVVSTYWVEPTTGVVVDTQRQEVRSAGISLPDGTVAGSLPVYDVMTAFTQQSVQEAADDASGAKGSIDLFGRTLPLILLIAGLVALAAAVALFLLGRRSRPSPAVSAG
jgi:hypothetical protein